MLAAAVVALQTQETSLLVALAVAVEAVQQQVKLLELPELQILAVAVAVVAQT
jgi:hypothetical protein